jgi:hypothetical protein
MRELDHAVQFADSAAHVISAEVLETFGPELLDVE